MKQIRDAIVIGSGIIGSAIALAVVRAGIRRVTLIEKGPLVSGMTRRTAGMVHPFQSHPLACDLARSSYAFYNLWAANLGGKNLYVETGAAAVTRPGEPAGAPYAMWQGMTDTNEIRSGGLSAVFSNITPALDTALYTPQAGYADAVLTAQAMVNAAKERGLEVQTGTQVKQIVIRANQIDGVKTTAGDLEAPIVISAVGGWTERLLAPLGISLHLRYRRGSLLFYEQPREQSGEFPILLEAQGSFFLRPHPYHMLAAGRVSNELQTRGVDSPDEYISSSETDAVSRAIAEWLPGYTNLSPKRSHTILYVAADDGLPAFGRVGMFNGLYVAAGFGTGAFAVAPAVGETLAQLITDGGTPRDLSSFDPTRDTLRS